MTIAYFKQTLILAFAIIVCSLLSPQLLEAKGVYQTEENFLSEVFKENIPASKGLLVTSSLRKPIEKILNHPFSGMRIKYWENDIQSVWILEEIGKEHPITFGLVVKNGKITKAKVLIFREIRGWEIKYPAFTRQFIGASLKQEKLNKDIDGVSGATLSVYAMTKVAKIALFLDTHINQS